MSRKAEPKRAGERRDHRRFPDEFKEVAVRMLQDLCWRRIVGWEYQEAMLLAALRPAIRLRPPFAGADPSQRSRWPLCLARVPQGTAAISDGPEHKLGGKLL